MKVSKVQDETVPVKGTNNGMPKTDGANYVRHHIDLRRLVLHEAACAIST